MFQPFLPNPYLPKAVQPVKRQEVVDGQVFDIVEPPTGYEDTEQSIMNSGTFGEGRVTGTGRISAPPPGVLKVGQTYNPLATVPVEQGLQEPVVPKPQILPPDAEVPYSESRLYELQDKQNPFAKFTPPVLPEYNMPIGWSMKDPRTSMTLNPAPSMMPPVAPVVGENVQIPVPVGQELPVPTEMPYINPFQPQGLQVPGTNELPGIPGVTFKDSRTDIRFGNNATPQAPVVEQTWPNDATYNPVQTKTPLPGTPVPTMDKPIDMKEVSLFGQEPKLPATGPVPEMNVTPYDTTKIGQDTPPTTQEEAIKKQRESGVPEMYYAGKAILDAGALFNNMVQQPPPNIQMLMPQFERMRLDRTPYEQARTDVGEAQTGSYRQLREGISQASDLMKGVSAVTSGTQEQLAQIGVSEAGAQLGVEQQNQNIAMQEAQMQAQTVNNEQQMNYQIQQAAQARKDELISMQLGRIGDTAGAYAKYNAMKELTDRQDEINRENVLASNEIQTAMLEWQMSQNEMMSPEYESAERSAFKEAIKENSLSLFGSDKYKDFNTAYQGKMPTYESYVDKMYDKDFMNDYAIGTQGVAAFEKMYPGGAAPDKTKYTDMKKYESDLANYEASVEQYNAFKNNPVYKNFEMEHKFWTEASQALDRSKHQSEFAEKYRKEKGLIGTDELVQRLKSSMDRSRQVLER